MFDQLVDGVRKASESSLKMQQDMFKQLTGMFLSAAPGVGGGDRSRAAQKRWLDLGLEMLNKHREAVATTYRVGIELIERTFSVTDVKSPEDFRKVVEELSRKLVDLQKEQAEGQFRDFQGWLEKSAGLVRDARA